MKLVLLEKYILRLLNITNFAKLSIISIIWNSHFLPCFGKGNGKAASVFELNLLQRAPHAQDYL
jgi:hypothetical protein